MSRNKAVQPPIQEAPPPPPPPPQNPVPEVLMEQYLKQRNDKSCDLSEFHHAKYEEWMKYFGFSMERELQWYRDDKQRAQAQSKLAKQLQGTITAGAAAASTRDVVTPVGGGGTPSSVPFAQLSQTAPNTPMFSSPTPPPVSGIPEADNPAAAKSILKAGSRARATSAEDSSPAKKRDNEDPIQSQSIPQSAQHGLEILHHFSARLEDADKHAIQVGPLLGKSLSEIVSTVTEPYKKITWRQDRCAVALLRTRSLYCWLCKNIKLDMPSNDSSGKGGGGREGGVRFADATPATPIQPSTPQKGAMKRVNLSSHATTTAAVASNDDPAGIHLPTINKPVKRAGGGRGGKGGDSSSSDALCQAVLDLRRGDPRKLSTVFMEMLQIAEVECINVKGALKGVLDSKGKPSGFISRWGWNVVTIPYPDNANELFPGCNIPKALPHHHTAATAHHHHTSGGSALESMASLNIKDANNTLLVDRHNAHLQPRPTMQLLIDVSLSLAYVGSRISNLPSFEGKDGGDGAAGGGTAGSVSSVPVSPRGHNARGSTSGKATSSNAHNNITAAIEANEELQAEKRAQLLKTMQSRTWEAQHANYSAATPNFTHYHDLSPHYEPFYFGCDPRMFVSLHYPEDAHKDALLLDRQISKPMWENYPRLDHTFYKYGLLLDSHRRKNQYIVKSAPFYVSFLLQDPSNVEMTAAIYQGTLSQLPSADWNKQPVGKRLGPGYVYSMREERSHRQTFTLMTPDVGQHTVVFGARHVHRDKSSHDVSNDLFDVVAIYNISVSFVALNDPILPHQHLTPATIKLVEPSSHKILLGPQQFTVVPTTSRVISVAVVNYLEKARGVDGYRSIDGSRAHSRALDSGVSSSQGYGTVQATKPLQGFTPTGQQQQPTPQRRKSSTTIGNKKGGRPVTPVESTVSDLPPPKTAAELKQEAKEHLQQTTTITVLELNPETATFTGEVNVEQGTIEIWTLIGDPSSIVTGATKKLLAATSAAAAKPAVGDMLAATLAGGGDGMMVVPSTPPDATSTAADASAKRDSSKPPSKTSKNGKNSKGDDAAVRTPSDLAAQALLLKPPVEEPIEIANGSGGAVRGMFVPAITHLQAVRRILPKEATLNDGREVIQPVMLEKKRMYADLPFVFRLLCTAEVIGAPGMAERRRRKHSANPYAQLEKDKLRVEAQRELDSSVRIGGTPLIEMRSMQSPSAGAKIKNLSDAEKLVLKPLKPVGQYFTS